MTDFNKGGTQWETKAAKRTKRRARNRRQPDRQKVEERRRTNNPKHTEMGSRIQMVSGHYRLTVNT